LVFLWLLFAVGAFWVLPAQSLMAVDADAVSCERRWSDAFR